MLKNEKKVQSFTAVSTNNDDIIAYFSASVTNNDASFNQAINDLHLYKTNKEVVENDYEEFKNHVLECLE